jgi:hypothetical protein
MMEVDLKAVKKRLKTLEEQVKTISAPLPPQDQDRDRDRDRDYDQDRARDQDQN